VSIQTTAATPPTSTRRSSDATTPDPVGEFSLDAFYQSMKLTRRMRVPRYVDLLVHPWLLDDSITITDEGEAIEASGQPLGSEDKDLVIHLVVTSIRQIFIDPDPGESPIPFRYPEFEVEGWLYAAPGRLHETIWVRCALRCDDMDVDEMTIYRLDPGEELGTAKTPGIN
jgi:hypothetical protein